MTSNDCSTRLYTLFIVLFFFCFPVTSMAESTAPGGDTKGTVLRGDAACVKCHDEDQAYPVLSIGKTRHGVTADKRTPTCTSCHGESTKHTEKNAGKDRVKPDITFSGMKTGVPGEQKVKNELSWPATPATEQSGACLGCHQGGHRIFWDGSAHATRDVACSSCHQVHAAHDRVRDKETQTEVCLNCHKEQRAQLHRPSHHPVLEGQMACSDCHNSHGSAGTKQLAKDSVNETCYQCHAEKRGPFVHNHQPVTEDCTICHNPHGTTVAKMLKRRPPYLCHDCHSISGHPGQLPALPTGQLTSSAFSRLGTVGRGCLNCHTNIHGSNSSEDGGRALRLLR